MRAGTEYNGTGTFDITEHSPSQVFTGVHLFTPNPTSDALKPGLRGLGVSTGVRLLGDMIASCSMMLTVRTKTFS